MRYPAGFAAPGAGAPARASPRRFAPSTASAARFSAGCAAAGDARSVLDLLPDFGPIDPQRGIVLQHPCPASPSYWAG
jgi:hypothetical protein